MTAQTLFAGFVFNFSKIFSDCCLDASALILATEQGRRRKSMDCCVCRAVLGVKTQWLVPVLPQMRRGSS